MPFFSKKKEPLQEKTTTESLPAEESIVPVALPSKPSEMTESKASEMTEDVKSVPTATLGEEGRVTENNSDSAIPKPPIASITDTTNLENNVTELPLIDAVSDNKPLDEVTTADAYLCHQPEATQPQLPADLPIGSQATIAEMTEAELQFLARLFKYGCLRTPQTGFSSYLLSMLDVVKGQHEAAWFHTSKSMEIYAQRNQIRVAEVKKRVLFKSAVNQAELPMILEQNDFLLALEQANKYQLWDWVSSYNPRKQRMLKIANGRKRGCLTPHLMAVLKGKTGKYGLLFDIISAAYEAFLPGERTAYYGEILTAYHNWLTAETIMENWLTKRQLYVAPANVGVALLLATNHDNMIGDLLEICENRAITTPIYFADKASFLVKPLSCWYSNVDQEQYPQFLTVRNQK